MRSSDVYLGLVAVVLGFGAVVMATPGGSPGAIGVALGLAVVFLAAMGWGIRHAPKVLLVGSGASRGTRDALDHAGYAVCTCPGPEARDCPAMRGDPCPISSHPVAAVIVTPASYAGPTPPCGEALHIPARSGSEPEETARAVQAMLFR
jgi:hypothetical protein